jgi:ABC-type proline/glycine betaine transport system ATPase subunit
MPANVRKLLQQPALQGFAGFDDDATSSAAALPHARAKKVSIWMMQTMKMMPWTCVIAEVNWRTRMEALPIVNRKRANIRFLHETFVGGKSQPCIA